MPGSSPGLIARFNASAEMRWLLAFVWLVSLCVTEAIPGWSVVVPQDDKRMCSPLKGDPLSTWLSQTKINIPTQTIKVQIPNLVVSQIPVFPLM